MFLVKPCDPTDFVPIVIIRTATNVPRFTNQTIFERLREFNLIPGAAQVDLQSMVSPYCSQRDRAFYCWSWWCWNSSAHTSPNQHSVSKFLFAFSLMSKGELGRFTITRLSFPKPWDAMEKDHCVYLPGGRTAPCYVFCFGLFHPPGRGQMVQGREY